MDGNKDNQQNYNMKCPLCGGDLCWDTDEMASDVCSDYEGDEEAIVGYYTCTKCGRSLEIFDPTKEEKETAYRDFWFE